MRSTTTLLAAAGLVIVSTVNASPVLAERAVTCDEMLPLMSGNPVAARRFCNVYLQIIPKTMTAWQTVTRETDTQTTADYSAHLPCILWILDDTDMWYLATTTQTVTPPTITRAARTTTKVSTTITPETKTITETQTSTAYVDAYGSTIALMKRQEPSKAPSPVEHAKRAIYTPAYFAGMRKTDIRAACLCLEIPTPEITRQMQTAATATVTQTLQRTIRITTAVPRVVVTSTSTSTMEMVVTAAAPLATETAWAVRQIESCPPGTSSTWL